MSRWHAKIQTQLAALQLNIALEGTDQPIALIGPNGSGKTTVLRALAGAIHTDHAEFVVSDRVLMNKDTNLPMEDRNIGYVPQGYGLFPHLNAIDNVAFGLSTGRHKVSPAVRRERALASLKELDCIDLARRDIRRLSGGEMQRVALARALVMRPDFLLLDEPLAALDATVRRSVRRFLAERLRAFQRPSIIVTHDVRDIIALDALIYAIEGGQVVQSGSLDDLKKNSATAFIAEFVAIL